MSARTHPKIAATVGALALIALCVSAGARAGGQVSDPGDHSSVGALLDRRSPDTIDSTARALTTPGSDLRSPDTRDAALAATRARDTLVRDLRSPDTRDAALAATRAPDTLVRDLRSPDTRDAALAATRAPGTLVRDLRSPDTRDAALAAATGRAIPADTNGRSDFDWTDAGIGATSGFGIALLAAGALLLIRRSNGRRLAV